MKILLITKSNEDILRFIDLFEGKEELSVLKSKDGILKHKPKDTYDLIFCDLHFIKDLPFKANDFSTASTTIGFDPAQTKLVLLTPKERIKEAMIYVRAGSLSYMAYPLTDSEILFSCQNRNLPAPQVENSQWLPEDAAMLRTSNPAMKTLYDQIKLVSLKSTTVLITGETGSGKGILAKLIHHLSNRRGKAFISVHCGAIPETLLESELFGHEKGSFTGAAKQKKGKFEMAQGGTIFLDEIGTVSMDMQIKLLQVLQDRELTKIGGEKTVPLDIRVIAATNEDLLDLCNKGLFRRDLYYRLNVFPVHVPSLRDRPEDLPLICASLINKFNTQHNKNIQGLEPILAEALHNYEWPGNIRELENLIERAFILEDSELLTPQSFPAEILANVSNPEKIIADVNGTLAQVRQEVIAKIEEEYLRSNLSSTNGSIKTTALIAGITTRQLHKLLTKYKIDKNDYKNRNS